MSRPAPEGPGLTRRIFLIAAAMAAMAAIIVAVEVTSSRRLVTPANEPVAIQMPPAERIPSEAEIFFPAPAGVAAGRFTLRRATAHPRTLATYRSLRAYPGAPPRIPHGLTTEEFRRERCNTCHERGGYSQRFEAYAPVTPHPEQSACLQCHASNAEVVGRLVPEGDRQALCRQCHAAGGRGAPDPTLNWRSAAWPQRPERSLAGAPPAIPHDMVLRSRCTSCHAGPAAVAEIRTTHPERVGCTQCHVLLDESAAAFTRSVTLRREKEGGP